MMQPNPVLKKLGLADSDRVVIFHADDIGACQSSVDAYADLLDFGLMSSASTMVPCGWFPATAAFCRDNQSHPRLDMGIHLTLTSEYDTVRWGPISTRQMTSGLLDEDGYFPRTNIPIYEKAQPVAVTLEMEAQIERALAAGINPTHIDTHMGTVVHTKFFAAYLDLARRFRLAIFAPRWDEDQMRRAGYDGETAVQLTTLLGHFEADGMPLVDHVIGLPLTPVTDRDLLIRRLVENLGPGITHFLFHPLRDTPEIQSMTESWPQRVNDREQFLSEDLCRFVEQQGIHVIGYRTLQALIP